MTTAGLNHGGPKGPHYYEHTPVRLKPDATQMHA